MRIIKRRKEGRNKKSSRAGNLEATIKMSTSDFIAKADLNP